MTTPAHPDRPRHPEPRPNRFDDGGCGVKGCPCPHNPREGRYPNPPCDHGWTVPGPAATTGGTRGAGGAQVTAGVSSPNAARHCPTCKAHAEARKAHA